MESIDLNLLATLDALLQGVSGGQLSSERARALAVGTRAQGSD